MLKSYRRRAFLVLALAAFESCVAPSAHGDDGPTLWDVLSKTETPIITPGVHTSGDGQLSIRRALGPVPGITLAGADIAAPRKHSGLCGSIGDWFSNLETKTGSTIKATGSSTLTAQFQNISGSPAAFESDQYYGQKSNGLYTDTDVTVDATLFKWFHYTTRISNSLMKNPNDNRVLTDYHTANTRIQYGDINVSFAGNSLIDFSRYLHGVEVQNTWSQRLKTTVLYAVTKATTQTIVINGSNSSGPYYVYAGQIVDGSAQVRLDNQVLTSGVDYTLDSYNGQLNFLKNRIVLASDTIAVSFESLGASGSQGDIYGGRIEAIPTRKWSIAATFVTQTSPGSSINSQLTEQFYGNGGPNFYGTTQPIDPTKPLIITVGGGPLLPSQYQLSTQTLYSNQVFITLAVPQTSIVQIQFFPYNPNPTPGNRSVIGLDTKYTLGKLGSITLESALSGLSILNTNINGHAASLRADLNPLKDLHTILTVKDINPTFSSIQSPGFNQNEKSIDLATDYTPFSKLKLNLDVELAHRPSYSGASQFTIDSVGNDRFHQVSGGALYTLSKNSTLGLTMSDITTDYAVGGFSTTQSEALTYSQTIKKVGIDFSLNNNSSNVASSSAILGEAITTTTPDTLFSSTSSSYGGRFGMHWQALKSLNFQGSLSLNRIKTDSGGAVTDNTAKDSQISASYTGIRRIHINYSLDLSDTGSSAINSIGSGSVVTPVVTTGTTPTTGSKAAVGNSIFAALTDMGRDLTTGTTPPTTTGSVASGAQAGGGINSNLGGFGNQNNVINNSLGFTSFGGKSLSNRIQMDITPRKNMQLGINFSKSSSLGDYQYNSDSTSLGLNMNWQLSDKLQMTGNYNVQQLNYTGGFGATANNSAMFSLQGHPFGGKLGVQFGIQSMHTDSAFNTSATASSTGASTAPLTNTSNDLTSLTGRLDFPINNKETLFVEMLDSITSGYLANSENDIRFGLDYALTKVLKFSLGWQILRHTYSDPANADLNYHASNLLAQFGVHF